MTSLVSALGHSHPSGKEALMDPRTQEENWARFHSGLKGGSKGQ